jgi:mannose-P-dolichol utilization defect protein 1
MICGLVVATAALSVAASGSSAAAAAAERTYLLLFTETCYKTLLQDFDLLNVACLKSVVSKGLGLAIIAGSFLLKAPQIYNILASGSGRGLELSAIYLDVAAFICPAIYSFRLGYPFLSYGESVVILVQNVVIVLLVWHFTPSEQRVAATHKAGVVLALVGAAGVGLALPTAYLQLLPTVSIVFTVTSRVPQVIANCKTRDTGVASSITWLLNFAGALARVLTTLNETGDLFQLAGFAIGGLFSLIILVQIFMYGDSSSSKKKD